MRDGEITYVTDVDALAYLEPDGLTHRGGEVRWSMPSGEVVELRAGLVDAVVAQLHNVYYIDSVCSVRHPTEDGRTGMCDFEISNNARMGTAPIGTAISATLADGLSKRS